MSRTFKPKRDQRRWLRRLIAIIVLMVVCTVLIFWVWDDLAADRIARQYGTVLTQGVSEADISGARLSYRQAGSTGEPLLLIHGFLGSSYDFAGLIPRLSETCQVVAVDLIGFGLSDKSVNLDYSKQNMADLVHQLMRRLGHERYSVLAHSMGGEVALNLAYANPAAVSNLILLDSAGLTDLQQGYRPALPSWLIDGIFKNYLVQRLYFPVTVYNRQYAGRDAFDRFFFFNNQIPAATLGKLTADNDSGRLAGVLDQIRQPTLIIWGRNDRIIPLEQGVALAASLPDSRLVVLDDCGHLPYLEKPDHVLAEILGFLSSLPANGADR
jgi:pimeloyl-ACP methyl ester carboxylesterase